MNSASRRNYDGSSAANLSEPSIHVVFPSRRTRSQASRSPEGRRLHLQESVRIRLRLQMTHACCTTRCSAQLSRLPRRRRPILTRFSSPDRPSTARHYTDREARRATGGVGKIRARRWRSTIFAIVSIDGRVLCTRLQIGLSSRSTGRIGRRLIGLIGADPFANSATPPPLHKLLDTGSGPCAHSRSFRSSRPRDGGQRLGGVSGAGFPSLLIPCFVCIDTCASNTRQHRCCWMHSGGIPNYPSSRNKSIPQRNVYNKERCYYRHQKPCRPCMPSCRPAAISH
jgi:hypothetical protein